MTATRLRWRHDPGASLKFKDTDGTAWPQHAAHPAKLDGDADHQHATELLALALLPPAEIAKAQRASMARWVRTFDKPTDDVNVAVEEHAKKEPKPNLIDIFAAQSGRGGDVHFLIRGEVDRKREVAKTGFVQVLMNHADHDQRWLRPMRPAVDPRVSLANWITDAEYGAGHLLARVIVNRLWQHHFAAVVATPNDSASGAMPTHPELLDYLAQR